MSQHQEKVSLQETEFLSVSIVLASGGHSVRVPCPSCRVDVVICLSTTVRNDTLQEAKEQRVSLKCRKQLRVEELEMVTHAHTHFSNMLHV